MNEREVEEKTAQDEEKCIEDLEGRFIDDRSEDKVYGGNQTNDGNKNWNLWNGKRNGCINSVVVYLDRFFGHTFVIRSSSKQELCPLACIWYCYSGRPDVAGPYHYTWTTGSNFWSNVSYLKEMDSYYY